MFNKPASADNKSSVVPPISTAEPTVIQTQTTPSQTEHQSSKKLLLIVSIIVLVLAAAFSAFAMMVKPPVDEWPEQQQPVATPNTTPEPTEEATFCTMDAKICPDGSSVGRVPPSCEFAACPGEDTTQTEGSTQSAMPAIDTDSSMTSTEAAEN